MDNLGYVLAGYLITAVALSSYAANLVMRSRRARRRSAVMAEANRRA